MDPKRTHCTAIVARDGQHYTYAQLLRDSGVMANKILREYIGEDTSDSDSATVAFLCDPSYEYVVTQWAIFRSGCVAVPLCNVHPTQELEYYIENSNAQIVLYSRKFRNVLQPIMDANGKNIKFVEIDPISAEQDVTQSIPIEGIAALERFHIDVNEDANIIYTSGSTGKPKGVVSSHKTLEAQVNSMLGPWEWAAEDRILHVLPLHHVHGVVNGLMCAQHVGASVEFFKFNAKDIWERWCDTNQPPISLFMAVPTIYVKLIKDYEKADVNQRKRYSDAANRLRLMVSGSAPLPETIFERWREITGQTLLERYGMTEIGMALSNPLNPITERRPGHVGFPLPGVEAKIVDEHERDIRGTGDAGELRIKGDTVFKYYLGRPDATEESFDSEGYFMTGDTATCDAQNVYKIVGRTSVDVLKHKGYKISALDIENSILESGLVRECAVVGLDDIEVGQEIAALVVPNDDESLDKDTSSAFEHELRNFLAGRIAPYKIPTRWVFAQEVPRNSMGKVNKRQLVRDGIFD